MENSTCLPGDHFGGTFSEEWTLHYHQLIAASSSYDVPDRDRVHFLLLSLCDNAVHFCMEVVDGVPCQKTDWAGIKRAFSAQYTSLWSQEEAWEVLDRLRLEDHRQEGDENRSALSTVVKKLQGTVPVALPTHREILANLRSLTRKVSSLLWACTRRLVSPLSTGMRISSIH